MVAVTGYIAGYQSDKVCTQATMRCLAVGRVLRMVTASALPRPDQNHYIRITGDEPWLIHFNITSHLYKET